MAVTAPPDPWINPGMTSLQPGDPSPNNQWLAIRQARQENLDLRRENQRILMLQGGVSGRNPVDHQSDLRPRYQCILNSQKYHYCHVGLTFMIH